MKLLITGSTGFVGQKSLAAFDRAEGLIDQNGLILLESDSDRLKNKIESFSPTHVLHLAAQSNVPVSFEDPLATFQINFLGTFNLLQALKNSNFTGKVLYVGSSDTYGLCQTLPITEQHPLKPRNPYAVSKVAAEALCYQWSQTCSFEIVMTRPFNHIGSGQSDLFVVSDFAKQIVEIKLGKREPVIYVGDIDVSRDFTDVKDVIDAYRLLLASGVNGEVYNICSGVDRKIRDVIKQLEKLVGVSVKIEQNEERSRQSEQRRVLGSYDKIHEALGWQPTVSFEQSLNEIINYWEEKLR